MWLVWSSWCFFFFYEVWVGYSGFDFNDAISGLSVQRRKCRHCPNSLTVLVLSSNKKIQSVDIHCNTCFLLIIKAYWVWYFYYVTGAFGCLSILNSCLNDGTIDCDHLLPGILKIIISWKNNSEDSFLFSWWVQLWDNLTFLLISKMSCGLSPAGN